MDAAPPRFSARWMWPAAAALMLGEFLLFDRMASRHVAAFYPRWSDQIQYLAEAYTAYQHSLGAGILGGLRLALSKSSLQGTLHDFAAVLVFHVAGGPSRSAALSLNMLAFLAWQAALLFAVARAGGSRVLGWMAFGLVLCLAWPWTPDAGSALDFRLDHAAMCLAGVASALALLTDGFRSTRWSVALGLALGVLILARFLTSVYLGVLFIAAAGWVLSGADRWPRLRNLLLAGLAAAALAAPLLWQNRQGIYQYYWVGHLGAGEGDVRAQGFTPVESARFIFGHLLGMHLGPFFLGLAGAVTAVLGLLALTRRQAAPAGARGWLFFGLAFLLGPALVLGYHRQKSYYVLGILAPGAVLLILWAWAWLLRRIEAGTASVAWRKAVALLAAAVVVGGESYFVARQLAAPDPAFVADARTVNRLADQVRDASAAAGLDHPRIASDQNTDFFDAAMLQILCFERHREWVMFTVELPRGIVAEPEDLIRERIAASDFVLLTDRMPGEGYWPYDRQMRRLYPELKAWCEAHRTVAGHYSLFGREVTLYQRTARP